jgi:hypothetical protein
MRTPHQARHRIAQLRAEIARLDYICAGSLLRRTKVCGKAYCRCAHDPDARHGPYYEWSRLEGTRLVHLVLTPAEARLFARAMANYRRLQRLLRRWERDSIELLRAESRENA